MSKRVVFDTNVLLSALIRADTPPALAVDRAIQSCVLLTAPACFEELQNKVHKPKFARYFSREEADLFLETYLWSWKCRPSQHPLLSAGIPMMTNF